MALGRRRPVVDARKAGSVEAALRRSLRAAVAGDWETAETWLERIVEADSSDLDAYHALARLYREQGAMGRAIRMHQNLLLRADLDKAKRNDALLELARDFDAGGFSERAAAGYEEVLDSMPSKGSTYRDVLSRLIELLHETREYPRALALVKRLRRVDKDAADKAELTLLLADAQACMDEGDADGTRTRLKKCLRRFKTSGEAWSMLGEIEAERGRDAKAIDAWRRAIDAEPTRAEALYPKIDAGYAARGKSKDFEKLLRSTLESSPTDTASRIALCRMLSSRGDTREAIEDLSRAIEISPLDAQLRVELGRVLLDQGHEAEALKAYAGLLDVLGEGVLIQGAGPASGLAAAGSVETTETANAEDPENTDSGASS